MMLLKTNRAGLKFKKILLLFFQNCISDIDVLYYDNIYFIVKLVYKLIILWKLKFLRLKIFLIEDLYTK